MAGARRSGARSPSRGRRLDDRSTAGATLRLRLRWAGVEAAVLAVDPALLDGRQVGDQGVDLAGVLGLPGLQLRLAELRDLDQEVNAAEQDVDVLRPEDQLPFCAATKQSSIAWATRTAASSPTIRAAPLSEWAARIRGSIASGAAEAPSSATRPAESVAVWLSASMRKSSISEKPLRSPLTARRLRKRREDPLLVEQADAPAVPGQDGLAEPDGRIDQGRGNGRHWLRGTRWTPRTSSAAKAQVSARSRSRSTTSRGGDAGGVDAQQAVERDAELGLALQVHQPGEDAVRAVGDPVHGPGRGDLGDGPGAEGQPFRAQPEDQDADPLALGDEPSSSSSPTVLVAARSGRRSRSASQRDHSARYPSGAGRSKKVRAAAAKTGQFRQWTNVLSSGQLRSPETPMRFQQSPSPWLATVEAIPGTGRRVSSVVGSCS